MKFVEENINHYLVSEMKGGKGEDTNPDDVDQKQLAVGKEVEMEHTNDKEISAEISLDHLEEVPDYYSKLVKAGLVDEEPALDKYDKLFGKIK